MKLFGTALILLAKAADAAKAECAAGCPEYWKGDNWCDQACNNPACNMDDGDCEGVETHISSGFGSLFPVGSGGQGATYIATHPHGYGSGSGSGSGGLCNDGCYEGWEGDNWCDDACNVPACNMDGGDCGAAKLKLAQAMHPGKLALIQAKKAAKSVRSKKAATAECAAGCPEYWKGDNWCDEACNNPACNMDDGDCEGVETHISSGFGSLFPVGSGGQGATYIATHPHGYGSGSGSGGLCNDGCYEGWEGDNWCDDACNVPACNMDGGDCGAAKLKLAQAMHPGKLALIQAKKAAKSVRSKKAATAECAAGCPEYWKGDNWCDEACNNPACNMDDGDCEGVETHISSGFGSLFPVGSGGQGATYIATHPHGYGSGSGSGSGGLCNDGCYEGWEGDNWCDDACNVPACNMDGGDCGAAKLKLAQAMHPGKLALIQAKKAAKSVRSKKAATAECAAGCPEYWKGDNWCDEACNNPACNMDDGDCEGVETHISSGFGSLFPVGSGGQGATYIATHPHGYGSGSGSGGLCNDGCYEGWEGDNWCDDACNVPACNMDGGDCGAAKLKLAQAMHPGKLALIQAKKAAKSVRSKKAATAECAAGCPEYWKGDNWCDEACNNPACNMDDGDCEGVETHISSGFGSLFPVGSGGQGATYIATHPHGYGSGSGSGSGGLCNDGCYEGWEGDNWCDDACNVPACNMDGGDCGAAKLKLAQAMHPGKLALIQAKKAAKSVRSKKAATAECAAGCPEYWKGDNWCDEACNNPACNMDDGDCEGVETHISSGFGSLFPVGSGGQGATYIATHPHGYGSGSGSGGLCNDGCYEGWEGDNWCDDACNVPACNMDGGDCGAAKVKLAQAMHPGKLALIQAKKAAKSVRSKKAATAECAAGCPEYWKGDNWCDEACNNPACNMDDGDCEGVETHISSGFGSLFPVGSGGQGATYIATHPHGYGSGSGSGGLCNDGCYEGWEGDNWCDDACNVPACNMDGGDCGAAKLKLAQAMHPGKLALIQAKKAAKSVRSKKAATAECAAGCPEYWKGDNWCDEACNNPACNMDDGDCEGVETHISSGFGSLFPVGSGGQGATYIATHPHGYGSGSGSGGLCNDGCYEGWEGDNWCDEACNVPACNMDGGDCGAAKVKLVQAIEARKPVQGMQLVGFGYVAAACLVVVAAIPTIRSMRRKSENKPLLGEKVTSYSTDIL